MLIVVHVNVTSLSNKIAKLIGDVEVFGVAILMKLFHTFYDYVLCVCVTIISIPEVSLIMMIFSYLQNNDMPMSNKNHCHLTPNMCMCVFTLYIVL